MFERRLQVLLLLLAIVSFALIARAFSVQVLGRSYWAEQSEKAMRDEAQIPTTRGRLLDFKGRELAVDQPCRDVCIDYRAILFEPLVSATAAPTAQLTARQKWLRDTARARVKKRMDNYTELPLSERKKLLDAEVAVVERDIEQMWLDLARLTNKPIEELDEARREIIRRVETQARIAWYNKFERAQKAKTEQSDPAWYAWMLGGNAGSGDIDKYELSVAEQGQAHAIVRDIDSALGIAISKNQSRYPGLTLRESVRRYYPYGSSACHVIGRLAKVTPQDLVDDPQRENKLQKYGPSELIGREGLEAMVEQQLRGTRGLQVDAGGEKIEDAPPIPGGDVRTTIDIELQTQIEQAFSHVLFNKDTGETLPMTGAAVAVDVASGEVRALASFPTYDLNHFDDVYPKLIKDEINRPLHNRATQTALEPGSTVKPIVGMGAISDGLMGANDTIECTGFLIIGGKRYSYGRCWTMRTFHVGHHQVPSSAAHLTNGFLTFADALERSCNVFFEELGDRLQIDGLAKWYDKFGLGRVTGIGLPESKGRTPKDFEGPRSRRQAVAWFGAIGQDQIAATPIQMANVAATIARGGVWMPPSLVPGRKGERIDLQINKQALQSVREGMINVVNGPAGTGQVPRMSQVLVAGKTGSAQSAPLRIPHRDSNGTPVRDARGQVIYDTIALGTKANPNPQVPWYRAIGETESDVPSHAWMIGFAPANNPKIAYAVMVEYGGGGGVGAGSVAKQLLEACLEHGYLPAN